MRYALSFLLGVVIGTYVVCFIWSVTDCEYAPSYAHVN